MYGEGAPIALVWVHHQHAVQLCMLTITTTSKQFVPIPSIVQIPSKVTNTCIGVPGLLNQSVKPVTATLYP